MKWSQLVFFGVPMLGIFAVSIGLGLLFSRAPVEEDESNWNVRLGWLVFAAGVLVAIAFTANLSQHWYWHP